MFFDRELQSVVDAKMTIERELGNAIAAEQLTTYFQPKINQTGKLIGVEALVRWPHPERGLMPPDQFLPFAEQCELIHGLQALVLKQACQLLLQLQRLDLLEAGFTVAINISARQFRDHRLLGNLLKVLNEQGIQPSRITLEITETIVVNTLEDAAKQLGELRALGFRVSLDDFGTGYSSLLYLHHFPVDELKIDKVFVHAMHDSDGGGAIVSLAGHFGFEVIAEGIETEEQLERLRKRSIRGYQGYHICRPAPAGQLIEWIQKQSS